MLKQGGNEGFERSRRHRATRSLRCAQIDENAQIGAADIQSRLRDSVKCNDQFCNVIKEREYTSPKRICAKEKDEIISILQKVYLEFFYDSISTIFLFLGAKTKSIEYI